MRGQRVGDTGEDKGGDGKRGMERARRGTASSKMQQDKAETGQEAIDLTGARKGDNKAQGNLAEVVLARVREAYGPAS